MIATKTNSITCPKCGQVIPLQEAMERQMETEIAEKLKGEQERMNINAQEIIRESEIKIRAEQEKQIQEIKEREERAKADADQRIREMEALNAHAKEEFILKGRELETEKARLKADTEKLQSENESKLAESRKRVEEETKKRIEDDNILKQAQDAVAMQSLRKEIDDLKRKAEQTSQQLIGEAQEIALENALKMAFPGDIIEPVQKGTKGADCIQRVRSDGHVVGTIVWESKRTKQWLNEWTGKLKDDMRTLNATLAILVTQTLPSDMTIKAGLHDGVWVTDFPTAIPMASALRAGIISTMAVKTLSTNSDGKHNESLFQR
jgi:hypothetical protein